MRVGTRPETPLELAGLVAGQVPTPMMETYVSLMQARAIMAGTSLGLFDALADEPADAATLAARLGVRSDGVDVLLVALHAIGLLQHSSGTYRNSRAAEMWLVSRAKRPLRNWVGAFTYDLWDYLGGFEEVVRGGEPLGLHERAPGDPFWRNYSEALLESASLAAEPFARAVQTYEPQRLLDLAGGPGAYSMAMCDRHPGLRATVVELPPQARLGEQAVAARGLADRVEFRAGDLFEIELGCGYDVAIANNVLHTLHPDACVRLLRRAHEALREDGTMAVLELERPADGKRGRGLGSLTGLVFYAASRTRTYSAGELVAWFHEAGFREVRTKRPLRLPGNVIVTGLR